MGTLEYLIGLGREDSQKSALANFARQQFGENSPYIGLADNPEVFKSVLPYLLDPAKQALATQQSALQELVKSRKNGGAVTAHSGAGISASGSGISPEQEALLAIASPDEYIKLITAPPTEQQAKDKQSALARSNVDTVVGDTQGIIGALAKLGETGPDPIIRSPVIGPDGATISEGSDFLDRIGNTVRGIPGIGQWVQQVFDPRAQELRNKLSAQKSQLLSLYRTAAQIPASASNSDVEQQNLANALPSADISDQANYERLKNFQKLYGELGKNPQGSAIQQVAQQNSLQAQADAAIKDGADPEKVRARLMQLQGGR